MSRRCSWRRLEGGAGRIVQKKALQKPLFTEPLDVPPQVAIVARYDEPSATIDAAAALDAQVDADGAVEPSPIEAERATNVVEMDDEMWMQPGRPDYQVDPVASVTSRGYLAPPLAAARRRMERGAAAAGPTNVDDSFLG